MKKDRVLQKKSGMLPKKDRVLQKKIGGPYFNMLSPCLHKNVSTIEFLVKFWIKLVSLARRWDCLFKLKNISQPFVKLRLSLQESFSINLYPRHNI